MIKRVKEIAYMRAFAALSIIMIHSTSGYINTGFLGSAVNQIPRFGSPLFVMMSGFILYHIELNRPSVSYLYFFKHRFLKVAIPYLIWTVFYTTFSLKSQLLGGFGTEQLAGIFKIYLVNIFTGTGYVHLYFILIMIQLYSIFPLLKRSIEKNITVAIALTVFISLTFQMLIYIHRLGIITLPDLGIAYATLFPGWLFIFAFGILLRIKLDQITDFWQKRKTLCLLSWLTLMVIAVFEVRITKVEISLRPVITLYGVFTFFTFYLFFEKLKNLVTPGTDRLIEWVANNSFEVYLVHPFILNMLVIFYSWPGYIGALGLYMFAVIFTCLSILILNWVRWQIRALSFKEAGVVDSK
ncbi:MAG: acyltransferase [Peptococcaceae bacterium]|nr:acyltransferase [Peptococcaceae bacterium]